MQPGAFIKSCEIGMRIRNFRQRAGLSQEKLAELVGVTTQQIQKYEYAKTRLSTDRIQLIAQALQVHVAAFFHERSEGLALNETEADVIQALRKIQDRQLHSSIKLILDRLAAD